MRPHKRRTDHASSSTGAAGGRREHRQVLCGIHAIHEALRVGTRPLERIWLAEGKEGKRLRQIEALAAARGTPIEIVAAPRILEAARTAAHQGIVAFVASSPLLSFDEFVSRLTSNASFPHLVALDGVKDPRNLGAIIRSGAAFGIWGVIVPRHRAAGLTSTVTKAAAGGLEHVHVAEVTNLSQSLEHLKRLGFWIVGADEHAEISCRTFAFPTPVVFVLGDEGAGISPLVKRHCDALVRIPACGPLHSLNVAVAAAVLFYELRGRDRHDAVAATSPASETSAL